MNITISIRNINQEEFKELFDLNTLPQLFERFEISDVCHAKNLSVIGDGIIEGEFFKIIVELTTDVVISLFSSFLYDKINSLIKKQKAKNKKTLILNINDNEVEINDKFSIERTIEDEKPRQ